MLTTRFSRRRMLRGSALLPLAPRLQDATPTPGFRGTTLRILMPAHPLRGYDDAIRTLATTWSAAEGVTIRLDIVPAEDIPAAFAAERELDAGHDLIATHLPMLHHAGALRDLASLFDRAEDAFGPAAEPCDRATRLPDGRRPAFSIAYAPAPLLYRRSIWDAYGLPNGPLTWAALRETGAQIWDEEGRNVGFGLAAEPGSERVAALLLAAYGGALTDEDGEITLDSPETVAATSFAGNFFRSAMSPESLAWTTDRPGRLLADDIASIISDDVAALRLAEARSGDTAADVFLAAPPVGPSGTAPASLPTSFRAFHVPLFATNPEAAEAFLLMLVASSEALVGAGQLTDRPAYGSLVPGLVQAGGWLDADPYGSRPREKLAMLKGAAAWTAAPRTALETQAHETFLLARMMARVARGETAPANAVTEAAAELRAIRDDAA